MALRGKLVEVARVDEYSDFPQKINRKVFVRLCSGDAQHGIPASFDIQSRAGFLTCKLVVEHSEVRTHTIKE